MDYVHPEVVILMGDLLDEGSIGDDWEFDVYAQRLKQLYTVPENVKVRKKLKTKLSNISVNLGKYENILKLPRCSLF